MRQSLATIQKHLPQYTPEQLERLRTALTRPQLPADAAEAARRWHAWWEEQAQAMQACEQPPEPAEQPLELVEQSGRSGRPRIDFPHLDAALAALGEKWPKARLPHSQITKRHIKFVGDCCREGGDEIERIYDNDGKVIDEALEKAVRRRIEEWKKKLPT